MNGITILSEISIYVLSASAEFSLAIGLCGLLIFGSFFVFFSEKNLYYPSIFFILLTLTSFFIVSYSLFFTPLEYSHQEYKVLIGEKINMLEFSEKYEITNQNGHIFTIKERDNSTNEN